MSPIVVAMLNKNRPEHKVINELRAEVIVNAKNGLCCDLALYDIHHKQAL